MHDVRCDWQISNGCCNGFVATTSYKRRSNICRRDEWVSLRLEFWSARPDLTRCFPVLSIVFFFLVVRHSHSIHSFLVLSTCDSWLIATSTLCFQTLLLYYGRQQKTINISQSFPDCARLIINILMFNQPIIKALRKKNSVLKERILLIESAT